MPSTPATPGLPHQARLLVSERVLMVQNDQNGRIGEFNARNFQPRKSVIQGLTEQAKKKASEGTELLQVAQSV
ncbi:uncharacterized protein B0H18DRAFT_988533 [Fomitopsis serialis]|uniref:uncharacterized protein n=1 Tax=Fomitopsis serialis TaxID=139415 RepID=UPI002007B228|nr:uncharacterized protein B0H18DRAFT_988533 [Neoantrodia serialis]KAH9931903.1 hypothetical protein B0H18DRAFT_988533 [Neoantrodia serialis]